MRKTYIVMLLVLIPIAFSYSIEDFLAERDSNSVPFLTVLGTSPADEEVSAAVEIGGQLPADYVFHASDFPSDFDDPNARYIILGTPATNNRLTRSVGPGIVNFDIEDHHLIV